MTERTATAQWQPQSHKFHVIVHQGPWQLWSEKVKTDIGVVEVAKRWDVPLSKVSVLDAVKVSA